MWFSIACFCNVSLYFLIIIFLVQLRLLSGRLLGKSCQLGWQFVLFVFLFIFEVGFTSVIWIFINTVPD